MIIVNLKGGLGNQMFQYAAGRALAKNPDDLVLNISGYSSPELVKSDTPRFFTLNKFNIKGRIATSADMARGFVFKDRLIGLINRKVRRIIFGKGHFYRLDKNFFKHNGHSSKYLNGYYQSESYFKKIEDTIRSEFLLRAPLSDETKRIADLIELSRKEGAEPVSIHVRRGDYAAKYSDYHSPCLPIYYDKARKIVESQILNHKYFVFSDDIEWTKKHLNLPKGTVFVSKPEIADFEEIILMSKCNHFIIANSTFSWWGAWLGNQANKIVVAPKLWVNAKNADTSSVCPSNWIKI